MRDGTAAMTADDEAGALADRLRGRSPRAVWRSLDEHAGDPAFLALLRHEFPALAAGAGRMLGVDGPSRRRFLAALAATLSFGGTRGARAADGPEGDNRSLIVPFVRQPESAIPSAPIVFSTATLLDGVANATNVTTRNGRPLKIEGNDAHPWCRGGTDIFGQASVLGFYDPDRSQSVLQFGRDADWPGFVAALVELRAGIDARRGDGFRILTGPVTAPTLLRQIASLRGDLPGLRWHMQVPPAGRGGYAGTRLAFGRRLETRFRFAEARVIVALDGDFLDNGPQQVGNAQDWVASRRASHAAGRLLTLHAASSVPSLTSAKADHAAVVGGRTLHAVFAALSGALDGHAVDPATPAADWVRAAADALRDAGPRGMVTAGRDTDPVLQAAVHRLNARRGATGLCVFHTDPLLPDTDGIEALVDDMAAGRVDTVLVLGANPVYDTPDALGFARAYSRVPNKIHAGLYNDETAQVSDWHLPLSHELEDWGDARAADGTATVMQPTIDPIWGTKGAVEILATVAAPTAPAPIDARAIVRATHGLDDAAWQHALLSGFVPATAFPAVPVVPVPVGSGGAPPGTAAPAGDAGAGLTVVVRPDPSVRDGSVANNGWLQELPRPLTKVTWRNVVAVGPGLAGARSWTTGDVVVVTANGGSVEGALWVMPGQADDTVALTLGYGRRAGGGVCAGLGYDANALLPRDGTPRIDGGAIRRGDGRIEIATTQEHNAIDGDNLVRVQPVGAASVGDDRHGHAPMRPTFYGSLPSDGRSWGMVIDLDSCIGCNACVVACQAENNIPVVGEEQVRIGREMHWLRIDRYYEGAPADPRTRWMPVPCMHCADAPCEVGCPVEATLHDHEGINLMVYNRCIGTRACSGYCPYKVRHFNYLDYNAGMAPIVEASRNPDVTVRARGVMEKCNYCIQRVAAARIESDRDDTSIADGTVRTACQQGCPTRAITFGDLADPDSRVAAMGADQRNYALLGELGLRPHTTYLAAVAPAGTTPVTGGST